MIKKVIVGLSTMLVIASIGCSVWVDPCPGQTACGNGCMPVGSVCCSDGTYCDQGYVCGGNGYCYPAGVSGCLAMGEETCTNYDGVNDCAPIGAACCHNHEYCPAGTVCCSSGCCY